jgi:hypothetical protein
LVFVARKTSVSKGCAKHLRQNSLECWRNGDKVGSAQPRREFEHYRVARYLISEPPIIPKEHKRKHDLARNTPHSQP